ncbi:MAG: TAXI family TRAP transporter solute-binding subunit [Hyphomicrobiaceae bacterium]
MQRTRGMMICAALAGAMAVLSAPAQAQYNVTLCGASPGGLWSLLGAGIDAALKAAKPGSTVTYQTSGGGFANVGQLEKKKCELAIVHDAEAKAAVTGQAPFKASANHLRTIAVLYTWAPLQMIVRKDFAEKHGIKSIEDLAAKKVPVRILLNRRGNVASGVGASMLTAAGASPKSIKDWGGNVTYAASKEQGELMRDRRADALLNSLFVNHRSIRQLASAVDLSLIPISAKTADTVTKEWSIGTFTVPAGVYKWAPEATPTVTLSAQLFVHKDADAKMVSDLATALVDQIEKVRGVHKAMKPLSAKLIASASTVPYHPAAESVYKAKGLR